MDKKLFFERRKVVSVINNCPAHPEIENLKSMKLFFFSTKRTSQAQPIDQGVICSLQALYCKNAVHKIIWSVEKETTLPKFLC